MTENAEPKLCPDCKCVLHDEGDIQYCSGFCAEVPEKQRREWLSLKTGDFGLYPCAECGCAIEDELSEERCCSTCWPKVQLRRRTELLREALPFVTMELWVRIKKELEEDVPDGQ